MLYGVDPDVWVQVDPAGVLDLSSGWVSYSAVVPTRTTSDDPTYVLTFAGVDLTSTIGVGMRVKWTQNSTVRYGIVTAIAFSTNTTLTLYGGTDYDVDDTATYPITAFNYSPVKAPLGFPLDRTKWTVEVTNTSNLSQASPTAATWYNLGSLSIDIPLGAWTGYYDVALRFEKTAGDAQIDLKVTLSTSASAQSDSANTAMFNLLETGATTLSIVIQSTIKQIDLDISVKDTYYLNALTSVSGVDTLNFRGDLLATKIKFVSAYL
jgi:hypothetical protein